MRLKPHQPGCSMRCWKVAESKIDKVHQSEARGVLLNYIAELETMGLPIAKESVDLTVRLVDKPDQKCKKMDRNCKHSAPRRKRYYRRFQTKLLKEVALGIIDQERTMINYDAMHLQLSCRLVDFIRCNHKMIEKSNSINAYSIWYEIQEELSTILPTCLTQAFFDGEWSKIMTEQCLALRSAKILCLVQDFSEEVKECELVIPVPIDYDTCVRGNASGDNFYLWDQARSALSEVTVPRPLFHPSTSEFLLDEVENVAVPRSMALLRHRDIWVGDTGASVHCTNDMVGAHNIREPPTVTTLGQHGAAATASKLVDIHGQWCDQYGDELVPACLTKVRYNPKSNFNLASIGLFMQRGFTMTGDDTRGIILQKGSTVIKFDIKIETPGGVIWCGYFKRGCKVAAISGDAQHKISVNQAHCLLGHPDENCTRRIAKLFGWQLKVGEMKPCEACSVAKAWQANVNKVCASASKATEAGERIFLDLTTITAPDTVDVVLRKTVWHMIVDQYTGYKASAFFSRKNEYLEPLCQTLLEWEQQGLTVKYVRHDDAGENKAFIKIANGPKWRLHIVPEFTGAGTPQRNQLVELGFTSVSAQARAMLSRANLPLQIQYLLCCEALSTATHLSNLQVIELDGNTLTRYEHFYGEAPKYLLSYKNLVKLVL